MTSTFSREDLEPAAQTQTDDAAADDAADETVGDEAGDETSGEAGEVAGEPVAPGSIPTAVDYSEEELDLPVARGDEPMPDISDPDVQFDNDKYRAKMAQWVQRSVENSVVTAVSRTKVRQTLDQKITRFAKDHPDFEEVVSKNKVLAANQLAPDAAVTVARSPYAAEMLYKFGKDTALAIRVARMQPREQVVTVVNMIRDIAAEKLTATRTTRTGSIAQGQIPARRGPLTREQQLAGKSSMDEFAPASRKQRFGGRRYYK